MSTRSQLSLQSSPDQVDGARWATNFSVYAPWARISESPQWVADGCMLLIDRLSRHAGLGGWVLSLWGTEGSKYFDWDGTSVNLLELLEAHREESGALEDLVFESSTFGRFRIEVYAGVAGVGTSRAIRHSIFAELETEDGGHGAKIAQQIAIGIVKAWNPLFLEVRDRPLLDAYAPGPWRVGIGYITWINDLLGDVSAGGVPKGSVVCAERFESGTLLTVPGDLGPQEVVDTVSEVLLRDGIDEIPRDLMQSMEVPSRGEVPEVVEVGESRSLVDLEEEGEPVDPGELYRQQISGWLPSDEGDVPLWVQPESSMQIPVRFIGHTMRGDTEVFLHAVWGNERFGDPEDDLAVLSASRLLSVASWQLEVLPAGAVLEWHASTSSAATGLRNFLAVHGLSQIRVVHTPAIGGAEDE